MDTTQTLLAALHADPGDETARLALADWLEEQGQAASGELLRLHVSLRHGNDAPGAFERLDALLASGLRPLVPTRTNDFGMTFALIPPGRFVMGSPGDEAHRFPDEGPEHVVTLTRPFYFGAFPVTQLQFERVVGDNPSYFGPAGEGAGLMTAVNAARCPVERVSWEMAEGFCHSLSDKTGLLHRLPTEAEWEYACRAGISRRGAFHQGHSLSSFQANFDGTEPFGHAKVGPYLRRTVPVDTYPPNAFGIYDLHGNVSEWCGDWFDADYYSHGEAIDPRGPPAGEDRVMRGGSWNDPGRFCRTAFRYNRPASEVRHNFGVRVVLEYPG